MLNVSTISRSNRQTFKHIKSRVCNHFLKRFRKNLAFKKWSEMHFDVADSVLVVFLLAFYQSTVYSHKAQVC